MVLIEKSDNSIPHDHVAYDMIFTITNAISNAGLIPVKGENFHQHSAEFSPRHCASPGLRMESRPPDILKDGFL